MKSALRLAVSTAALVAIVALAPCATHAACSSGGTVANVNDCVPEGVKSNDCALEWSISPVPPVNPKTGVPTNKIVCRDNDPACDADKTPGQCTFMVGACVNVVDSRFTCSPTDVSTYLLKKPSAKDAVSPDKNVFGRDNRRNLELGLGAIVPTAATNVCSEERAFVVPLKKGTKKATLQIQAVATDSSFVADKDAIKFTCAPNPNIGTMAIAEAKQIASPTELIGGPLAMGRVGDWLIRNDKVRFVIRDVGRDFSFMLTYGGHIMDADFVRASGPGRDNFMGMTPLINISSTDNPTAIGVVNDGAAGGPAVLQTSGPDDLFDPIDPAVAIKGFSGALSIPPFAIDNNIPVTVMNEYTLAPGDDFVKIETIVHNNGSKRLEIYVGDYTNGGGQQEVVAPGLGFGESALRLGGNPANELTRYPMNYLGWFGFGDSQGVSYGLIPQLAVDTSAFSQSGVVVPVYGQSLLAVLSAGDHGVCSKNSAGVPCGGTGQPTCDVACTINTDCEPPDYASDIGPCKNGKPAGRLAIPPSGQNSFTRWFAVSDNGMGRILDARHKLIARGEIPESGLKTAYVQGTVRVDGVPVDGARVAVVKSPGARLSQYAVIDVFETKDGGFYQGTVPVGDYRMMVKIPGYPYEGGGASPARRDVSIKKASVVDFDVPSTGFVRVDVTNGVTSDPIPAKVSVVGVAQAVDPGIDETVFGSLHAYGNIFGYNAREKVAIHGLPQVQFADVSGSTPVFAIQPGSYQIVVSHGPEYSLSKHNITVVAGDASTPQVVAASVVPVVDTTGFVSADHHVHLIDSPDSAVSKNERIITMLAEGVDYFVASDHDFKVDLSAEIAALGASALIKTAISSEVTYFDSGHFGAYPMTSIDPSSVTGGSIDWGRAGVTPGLGYPSDGSYDLSIEEMALVAKGAPHNATVVQANHFNSGTLGYFVTSGIDTTVAPPQSSTQPARIRQNPALTNLYTDEITALEIWIENTREQNAMALGDNLGDYINILNNFDAAHPLQRKGIVCDSDTHSTTIIQAGGPRNMLASLTDDPALLDPAALAASVNAGRNVCTNGPFVRVSVEGDGGATASHDLADPLLVPATLGAATVHVDVQSPTWAEYDRVEIYFNNTPSCVVSPVNFLGSTKKNCTATPNFVITPTTSVVPVNGDSRLQSATSQSLTITQDSWVMVVVRGRDGVSKPLFPVTPQSMFPKACNTDPCKPCGFPGAGACPFLGTCSVTNQTLAELTDGNLGQCGVTTMAIANPLFIDFDGDGLYKGAALP
ncbi:MAG: hypothetical protein B6D46_10510 [Polyangiaceae bacterium UTPRO1]|jgi:hypothetical protein|nr:hypothetical protein [Myxococcales bacterium]OQY66387.1 MAG: hypothetical protein B6D46_10510 [Polyangiaceae bacterium UTPRO1]